MNFTESISTCFSKYVDFRGLATRSEFWWFYLFCFLAAAVLSFVSPKLSGIFNLATLLPSLAVGARRLHDTDKSGWWQLLWLVPVVGWIVLVVFWASESKASRFAGEGQMR